MDAASARPGRVGRLGLAGWMLFDWAAQPFFTVVTTFIFGPYFVSQVAENPAQGQALWGYAAAAAGIVIALLSPVLGSIADAAGPRKPWIAGLAVIKIGSLVALWWAIPGSPVIWPLAFFALATMAAEFSIVFNDSMMPQLVARQDLGRISNIAWGLGYLGGLLLLVFVVAFVAASPDTGRTVLGLEPAFGLDPARFEGDRAVGPLAAAWYLLFILPMMAFTPDVRRIRPLASAVRIGLGELAATLREARRHAGIFRFFVARMIYQDGVAALLLLGGAFAAAIFDWKIFEIGLYGIILNLAAIAGNMIASVLDTRAGSKTVVLLALAALVVATLGIVSTGPGYTAFGLVALDTADSGELYATAAEKAYIVFGLLIGLAFGPVQASSRSYLARSVPPADAGRYFGLYALAGRATSFLAPFTVASITAATGSARLGMAVIIVFLALGMALLAATPYPAAEPAGE
ncbi:MAG: MFS transporter [Rhodobiaceae bacterium]|nr:MFS transporter [Rhodobiaceae bacterium]MCC0041199.1 MFS transporter [Rhodobiaceae bacterium]